MNTPDTLTTAAISKPTLLRRLAAICYDTVVVIGLLLLVTSLIVVPLLDAGDGQGQWLDLQQNEGVKLGLQFACFAVMVAFHVGFWAYGGQTLGMRAWRLKLVRHDGRNPTIVDGLKRYLLAWLSALPLGLGFLWSLWDKHRYTWHDHLSGTHLIVLPRDR